MQKTFTILLTAVLFSSNIFSQDSTNTSHFTFTGYVDAYFAHYTDSLGISDYQKFTSVSPRSKQFGLNVAMITAKYDAEKVRGVITLHYGDFPRSSWAANYNFIQEANVGIRLSKKFWLDGGFFRTHLGTEACFPKENMTSSIAVPTFFEPYYESGFRLNYNANDKLALYLYFINGYNMYEDNNDVKSLGLLATYAFSDYFNIGYSNYFGDDYPGGVSNDTITHMRSMHNIFLNYKSKNKLLKVTLGADVAMQENADLNDAGKSASMSGMVGIVSVHPGGNWDVYVRGESFNDANAVLSPVMLNDDFELTGLIIAGGTLGVQYKPTSNSYLRLETRTLSTDKKQKIFLDKGKYSNTRMEVMFNIGVWFE
jgi:hypothetical protein